MAVRRLPGTKQIYPQITQITQIKIKKLKNRMIEEQRQSEGSALPLFRIAGIAIS
jgi:hypothetical protein